MTILRWLLPVLAGALCTAAEAHLTWPDPVNEKALGLMLQANERLNLPQVEELDAVKRQLGTSPTPGQLGRMLVEETFGRRPETVQWLITHGASCDYADPSGGITPLMAAVDVMGSGPKAMPDDPDEDAEALGAQVLPWRLPQGADERARRSLQVLAACTRHFEARDDRGVTALLFAARRFRMDVVIQLAAAGADINARDADGETVFWNAGPKDFAPLVGAHADIQASNRWGRTLLHRAVVGLGGRQLQAYVDAALAAGARDSRDKYGNWASDYGVRGKLVLRRTEDAITGQVRARIAATRPREEAAPSAQVP